MKIGRKDGLTDVADRLSGSNQGNKPSGEGAVSAANGEQVTLGLRANRKPGSRIAKK